MHVKISHSLIKFDQDDTFRVAYIVVTWLTHALRWTAISYFQTIIHRN